MRTLKNIFLVLATIVVGSLGYAGELRFNTTDYAFLQKHPVYLFELPDTANKSKVRVCYGAFSKLGTDVEVAGVAIPEDMRDCNDISKFGGGDNAYVISAVSEGREEPGFHQTEDERVKIKDKSWTMWGDAKVIFRAVGKKPDGSLQYAHICRINLRPLDLVNERANLKESDIPESTYFCKTVGDDSVKVKVTNSKGEVRKNKDGTDRTIETRYCPLPAKCLSPEFAIKPDLRIMPEEDESLVHNAITGIVHRVSLPTARPEDQEEQK